MRALAISALVVLAAGRVFAHVTVFPQQAPAGASQVYKVRVHNDAKAPTSSIALQIPDGVAIEGVAPVATGKFEMTKTGSRVTMITWQIEVPVGKYVELAFTATNPGATGQLNWNVTEKFGDGSTIEFTDKPGAKEKSSVTRLIRAAAPATPAK
jgi:uncharacterized protein YcnI